MSPWGWIRPARALLILVAAGLGSSLLAASASPTAPPAELPSLVLDANDAPAEVLEALPGIGPVLAGRIVGAREAARFRSIDDLDRRVKGIGPVKAAAIRPFLTFDDRR